MPGAGRVQGSPITEALETPVPLSPRSPKSVPDEEAPPPTHELGSVTEQDGDVGSEPSLPSNVLSITSAMVEILQETVEAPPCRAAALPPPVAVSPGLPREENCGFPKQPSAWRGFLNRVVSTRKPSALNGRQGSKQSGRQSSKQSGRPSSKQSARQSSKQSAGNECSICLEGFEKDTCERLMGSDLEASCSVTFEVPDSEPCTVIFRRRPLGMVAYVNRDPATVSAIVSGSAADALGVQEGWIIQRVNDTDVRGYSFADVFELLREATASLPMIAVRCGNCNMKFHCDCLQNWVVKGSNTCPMCRSHKLPLSVKKTPRPPRLEMHIEVEASLDVIVHDPITQPGGDDWSTKLSPAQCVRSPARSVVAACLCPCIIADTTWSTVVKHSSTEIFPCYHVLSFFMAFALMTVILSMLILAECTLPSTIWLHAALGRKSKNNCYMYELSWTISTLSAWLAFVSTLVVYRQHLSLHFNILYGGQKACLCQFCGCYSCTLLQEQKHARDAYIETVTPGQSPTSSSGQSPTFSERSETRTADVEAPPAAPSSSWPVRQPSIGAPAVNTQLRPEQMSMRAMGLPESTLTHAFMPA